MEVFSGYRCRVCGAVEEDYAPHCSGCGQDATLRPIPARCAAGPAGRRTPYVTTDEVVAEDPPKRAAGITGLDWVLNGGVTEGMGLLIGGEPGCGKTTLLTQLVGAWPRAGHGRALYVSGEETQAQVAARARRVGVPRTKDVCLLATQTVEEAAAAIREVNARLVVLDSIQAIRSEAIGGRAGSLVQMRYVCNELCRQMKTEGRALAVVCQVNKDGSLNGPKALEHIGDAVAYLDGQRSSPIKTLRVFKHRFGPTDRTAAFEMRDDGLHEHVGTEPSAEAQASRQRGRSSRVGTRL